MRLIADANGRLTYKDFFRPGTVFDVTRQRDGSFRVIELVEREVPVARLKNSLMGCLFAPRCCAAKQY